VKDRLHADQLQRDIRHGRENARQGHRELERARSIATLHHVRRRHMVVCLRNRPKYWHDGEDEGIGDDRIGQREEAVGAHGIDEGRHRDHCVGGVDIAADQEPGNPGAELASPKPPFVEMSERFWTPPMRRRETQGGDEAEEENEDRERRVVDLSGHPGSSGKRCKSLRR